MLMSKLEKKKLYVICSEKLLLILHTAHIDPS